MTSAQLNQIVTAGRAQLDADLKSCAAGAHWCRRTNNEWRCIRCGSRP